MPYIKNSELMPFLLFFERWKQLNPKVANDDEAIVYQLDRHKLIVADFRVLKEGENFVPNKSCKFRTVPGGKG